MKNDLYDFFKNIFPCLDTYIEVRYKKPSEKIMNQLFFDNIETLTNKLIDEFETIKHYDMYFGVCPRKEKEGKKENIKVVNCLWCDIDDTQNIKINNFEFKPNYIINSGHGFHLYWLLSKPYIINTTDDINKIEGIMKGISKKLGGDKTHDISRVLRIPFTINNKSNPVEVKILSSFLEKKYSISELEKYYIDTKQVQDDIEINIDTSQVKDIDISKLNIPYWLKNRIITGWEQDSVWKSRSEYDISVMCDLLKYKIDDETIFYIFTNPKYKASEKTLEKGKNGLKYFELTLSKAKELREQLKTEWERKVETFASFDGVQEVFNKWFYIEDQDYLKVIVATVISHYFDAKPVWLLLVAPPSATKTSFLMPLCCLPNTHLIGKLTAKAFFTAESLKPQYAKNEDKSNDPSLLYRFPNGILIAKDFTTILNLSSDTRAEILQDLREIWDGKLSKDTGKGAMPVWEGKITFIAGCTEFYESFREIDQTLGERFLLYKNIIENKYEATKKAMFQIGKEKEMNKELEDAIKTYFSKLDIEKDLNKIPIPQEIADEINYLSQFVVKARSSVQRDIRHEIIHCPGAEYPFRLCNQLVIIAKALSIINKHPEVTDEEARIVKKLGLMTIANERYTILRVLADTNTVWRTRELRNKAQMEKMVFHRVMENLVVYGLVESEETGERTDTLWKISPQCLEIIEKAKI